MITKRSELFAYLHERKVDNKIIAEVMQFVLNQQEVHEREMQNLMYGIQKLVQKTDVSDTVFRGCSVCGVHVNDGPMGYVCSISNCPTRVSCE